MLIPRPLLLSAALLAGLAGCAPSGSFPSLAPRPIERALAPPDVEPPKVAVADDPQLPARLQAFVAAGRSGQADFDAELASARRAVARSGGRGSDSWVEAQQAVSRLEVARATVANALSELNAYAVERANAAPLSQGDRDRIRQANAALQAIADAQQGELAALEGRLGK
jgi:hypothetical protein